MGAGKQNYMNPLQKKALWLFCWNLGLWLLCGLKPKGPRRGMVSVLLLGRDWGSGGGHGGFEGIP